MRQLIQALPATSVLDYGAGKCTLMKAVEPTVEWRNYDPAIPGLDEDPTPADLVVCSDVLEHVEPECLADVYEHIQALARKAVFFVIATRPAKKTLADGRNAHLIVRPFDKWFDSLRSYFDTVQVNVFPGEFLFLGTPR